MCAKSAAISCAQTEPCYDSAALPVLRCTSCRILVDVAASSAARCAGCGGPLSKDAPASTIWDDDDPTERRPIDYAARLASGAARR